MIINTDEIKNIYVSKQFCDMRKQIDGLALIVTSQFNMNVLDHSLFIFTNASRNRIKILYYEANGFWLFTRRLENGKFKFKKHEESGVLMITSQQLNWLIEGLEFENKINEDSITFKEMDIFDVKKKYNNKYDFINFSNIFNYVDTKKFISYIKQLLEDNLYNDGEIILDYIWEYSEKFQSFAIFLMDLYELNPNIITFNNNYNGNDAVVVKKKKRS